MVKKSTHSVLVFRKSGILFGFPTHLITEVKSSGDVHPLPLTPRWIPGLLRYGDAVLPILDLYRYLGFSEESEPFVGFRRLVIAELAGCRVAFAADQVFNAMTPKNEGSYAPAQPLSNPPKDIAVERYEFKGEELFVPDLEPLTRHRSQPGGDKKNALLLKFILAGRFFAADASAIHKVAGHDWSLPEEKIGTAGCSVELARVLGLDAKNLSRTLVIKTGRGEVGIKVDAISRTPIARHIVAPVPTLLHNWIQPMPYSGFSWDEGVLQLIAVLDLASIGGASQSTDMGPR